MPATDFRIAVGFFEHPKTLKLERIAGALAPYCFLRLIRFCAITPSRANGRFSGMDWDDIEIAAKWVGARHEFVKALISVRFLEDSGDGVLAIHEFDDHQPWVCNADARSEKARKAADARWGIKPKKESDATSIENDARSNAQTAKSDAPSIKIDAPILSYTYTNIPSILPNDEDTESQVTNLFGESDPLPWDDAKTKESSDIQTIWKAYREYHPRVAGTLASNRKEYKQAAARLKEFSVSQVVEAIRGFEGDYWYSQNSNSFEYYVRNTGNIEKGLELSRKPRISPKNEQTAEQETVLENRKRKFENAR